MKKSIFFILFLMLGTLYLNAQTISVGTYGVRGAAWNNDGKYVQIQRSGTTTFETGIMFVRPSFFDRPVKIDAVVFLETIHGITDISDTLRFTGADFSGGGSEQNPWIALYPQVFWLEVRQII